MTQHPKYSSREGQALLEAGKTAVSRAQKCLLAGIFLFIIYIVPLSQQFADIRAGIKGERKSIVPQYYDIFGSVQLALRSLAHCRGRVIAGMLDANRQLLREMHAYEDSMEDASILGTLIRPAVQSVMVSWFGAGNDKTYCGRGHWLFYRPDVDYAVNHGFLEKGVMKRRAAGGNETTAAPHPDPRPAVIAFNTELAAWGIKLILLPIPVKPVIHPEKFTSGFDKSGAPVHNSAYQAFMRDMKQAGIAVFDVSAVIAREREKREQYLAGDTHWRPEAVEVCARELGRFISEKVSLPAGASPGYVAAKTNVVQKGDIIAMLRLPGTGGKYGKESVTIRRIFGPDGRPWQADSRADILVLGDSFNNIYSLGSMGWGESAGLTEQLSYEMRRPVDLIAVNDHGAWATRELLLKELARGSDRLAARDARLAGKKVVVWQFAEREFTEGDWKPLPLKPVAARLSFLKLESGSRLNISGTIKAIAPVPRPRSVPYADHIIAAHLTDVTDGARQSGQAFVYLMSMTNHVLTPAAGLKAGEKVKLTLRPWPDVSAKYERINRTEVDDPELLVQEPCWGELAPEGK